MARRQITPPSQRVVTQYEDSEGNRILDAEYTERIIIAPDGSVTHLKQAGNVALNSGEMFNPSMAGGAKPILLPGLCAICHGLHRQRPPLTNVKHLRLCAGCGRPCCNTHRIQSRDDQKWRCPRCHRRHLLRLLLRSIFFTRIEK